MNWAAMITSEGSAYTVTDAAAGQITLAAGAFAAGNPVVVTYRTHGRFGFRRGPGDAGLSVLRVRGGALLGRDLRLVGLIRGAERHGLGEEGCDPQEHRCDVLHLGHLTRN